jgi:hypothetical protein
LERPWNVAIPRGLYSSRSDPKGGSEDRNALIVFACSSTVVPPPVSPIRSIGINARGVAVAITRRVAVAVSRRVAVWIAVAVIARGVSVAIIWSGKSTTDTSGLFLSSSFHYSAI